MVTVRPRGKGWQYDINFRWPDGTRFRERAQAPVKSKSAALRWAEARERTLLAGGRAPEPPAAPAPRAPTLAAFWPRVVRDHYEANRKKASTIDAAQTIYRRHLAELADRPIDRITSADVAELKGRLAAKSPKTANNVLSVLSRVLRCAVEWDVLEAVPCKIRLLKTADAGRDWYELAEYRRLVDGAREVGSHVLVLVLLAGSAGLRRGEILSLRWEDVDLSRRLIHVRRATWRKIEATPKGGRGRIVPATPELADALEAHAARAPGEPGDRVLRAARGAVTNRTVRNWIGAAQRRAGLEDDGAIHRLRHTFCSHLAAAGAPAKAIQELAGHTDLGTTQRYMHLSPANRSDAIATLAAYHARG